MRSTADRSTRSVTRSTFAVGRAAERRAWWYYRLRGYRILETNIWSGGNELDLVVRRGGTAANIAFGLAQLGVRPILVGAAGHLDRRDDAGEFGAAPISTRAHRDTRSYEG